ncbi:hypothetical protein E4U19_000816 [Claviceps sp. Clav32 group G5]|nr:hypothetical protein E4U19_000816 [Claviceps sp. Clav32 group G5]
MYDVARDPVTGRATFIRTEEVLLARVKSFWHDVKLDELEISHPDRLRQNVHVVTHPKINGGGPVHMKLAVLAQNFSAISPEGPNGRIIGFITEWLGGTRSAEPRDLDDYKKALDRLHQLHSFLVREGHEVVLVDFETTRRDGSHLVLEDEMNALKSSLESTDARGGPGVVQGQKI